MSKVVGRLENVYERKVNTKKGPATSYSLIVDGNFYGVGFDKPPFKEGTVLEFETTSREYNGKTYYDAKNVRAVDIDKAPAEVKQAVNTK